MNSSSYANQKQLNRKSKQFFWYLAIDEGNQALQEFLIARNPKQQHSSTLESYLIKPIQRILKYPLLLQQLRNLTDPRCEEHTHLVGAYFEHLLIFIRYEKSGSETNNQY